MYGYMVAVLRHCIVSRLGCGRFQGTRTAAVFVEALPGRTASIYCPAVGVVSTMTYLYSDLLRLLTAARIPVPMQKAMGKLGIIDDFLVGSVQLRATKTRLKVRIASMIIP